MADIDATPTATNTDLEGGTLASTGSFEQGNMGTGAAPAANLGGDTSGEQKSSDPRQLLKDGASNYATQATDKIRAFADTGKQRAGGALDQFSTMLTDAAGQVDEKLGAQYGDYARQAAGLVSNFSGSIKNKEVDDLLDDARGYVRQSPGVAIGVAAALGFVLARVAQSGIEGSGVHGSTTTGSPSRTPANEG
ncbi:hypothetical protein [uncultured Sphingomonas sp.]|uniref:hypothetical protein n=1 Tax=uncultured Sphingomonas sp. TaxID=158754 RepID=UPI0035CAE8A6